MKADFQVFVSPTHTYKNDGFLQAQNGSLTAITTCGLGRTRFSYESAGDAVPLKVYFANGSILQRHSDAKSWTLIEDNVITPWHGEVYVTDQEAIISSGAVADLFKLDGSHIRYLNGQIVMIVTMCGDVFEFEYEGKTLSEVKLDSQPYIQHKKGKWQLAGVKKTIFGVPHVSVHGFSFDAQEKHRYLDRYLTNGNLTTMRDGMYKFTFGAARV